MENLSIEAAVSGVDTPLLHTCRLASRLIQLRVHGGVNVLDLVLTLSALSSSAPYALYLL